VAVEKLDPNENRPEIGEPKCISRPHQRLHHLNDESDNKNFIAQKEREFRTELAKQEGTATR
jgi:hypothetical protein